jgi:hypothetical protein
MDAPTPTPAADDWSRVLAGVVGHSENGTLRVATAELLKLVDVPNNSITTSYLRSVMSGLGWRGPATMKINGRPTRGYARRDPNAPAKQPAPVPEEMVSKPVLTAANGSKAGMPEQLEAVTRLALTQAEEILLLPIDTASGNVMRAKTSIIGAALTTQSRVDESRLRSRSQGDVMERLGKLIRQMKRTIPKEKPIKEIEGEAA